MALNISNYLRNALLDEAIGGVNFTPAATLEIRLFSTTLDRDGAGTQLTNLGYAPVSVTNNTTNFPLADEGAKENAVQFEFPEAEENWDDILSVGIFDTSDNLYFYQNYGSPKTVENGQIWTYAPGEMTFDFS